jgi:hypothetical protein
VTARQQYDDLTSETLIGHVLTQEAAATVVRASMDAINCALQETDATEWLALRSVLAGIEVPSGMSLAPDSEPSLTERPPERSLPFDRERLPEPLAYDLGANNRKHAPNRDRWSR